MANLIDIAVAEAVDQHKKHTRKDNGTPYVWHPMRVAGRRMIFGHYTEEEIAACWLHDTYEDCASNREELEYLHKRFQDVFNPKVAELVMELTNPTKFSSEPRAVRKQKDREHLAKASPQAKIIKYLDRIDNLSETLIDMQRNVNRDWKFALLYSDESALLAEVLRGPAPELHEELLEVIRTVRAVANVMAAPISPI